MYQIIVDSLVRIFNEDAYLNKVISSELEKNQFNDLERRLFTKITYGVVENKILLDFYLQPFIKGKRVKPFMKNVLRVGAYAITFMDIANHFIVSKMVDVMKKKDFSGSKFVNGVLRNYERTPLRSFDKLSEKEYLSVKYSMPLDVIECLEKDLGIQQVEQILIAYQNSPKINSYRINPLVVSDFESCKNTLVSEIPYLSITDDMIFSKQTLIHHPFFINGSIIAQDYSSSLPVRFLNPMPGELILDSCSSPGMKTIQMAGMMKNQGRIIALDIYEHKLNIIKENAIQYQAKIIETKLADASQVVFTECFDKILVDAPCSGLGVIGHKPDLKYHMTKEKIYELAEISYSILTNVSQYLKENGTLVFSTCTITKAENEEVIKKFLSYHPNFVISDAKLIFPSGSSDELVHDGFYICKLIKRGK